MTSPPNRDGSDEPGRSAENGHRPEARERMRERADLVRERTRERREQVIERTKERTDQVRESTREQVDRARMSFQRLVGVDRSGPPPPQTVPGAPLNVWTIPNCVGFVRLALVPLFLVLALRSESGTDRLPFILFAVIAGSDYLDGFAARATGQFSRFGAMLDPLTDRALILAGGIVCWHFSLVPKVLLTILVLREIYVLIQGRRGIKLGLEMYVNWWGRLAVWPTMGGLMAALAGLKTFALIALAIGVAMSLVAAVVYTRQGNRLIREKRLATKA